MNPRLTLVTLALAAITGPVLAQTSPWYLGVAQAFTHDSNIRRVADGTPATGSTVSTTSLLAGLDQPIGRQRLFGTASVQMNRYSGASDLNNTGYGLKLGLDWSTAERVSGTLSLGMNQSLQLFTPGDVAAVVTKNIEKVNYFDGVVRVGVVTALTLEAGLNHRTLDYSLDLPPVAAREYTQDTIRLGARYRVSGALTVGAGLRHAEATYPRYLPNVADKLRRDDLDFTVTWVPSGASTLNARISATHASHSVATTQDLSGLTGALTWNWRPTGKLALTTELQRDSGSDVNFENKFVQGALTDVLRTDISRITNRLQLKAAYDATAKIAVTAAAGYARRSLRTNAIGDSDNSTNLALGVRWQPTRALQLSCDLSHEKRSAGGVLSLPYGVNTVGCAAQFIIQ
jgi:hypothetical protein